jgi:hypothetical protein
MTTGTDKLLRHCNTTSSPQQIFLLNARNEAIVTSLWPLPPRRRPFDVFDETGFPRSPVVAKKEAGSCVALSDRVPLGCAQDVLRCCHAHK